MEPSELDLRDIHLPADPAWWPPAVGWWLLLAVLLAAGAFAWLRWRRWRADRVRRAALASLDAIAARCGDDPARLLPEISVWLRRVALSVGERRELAALTGDSWLAALAGLSPGSRLTREYAPLLTQGPYAGSGAGRDDGEGDLTGLLAACREWTANLELSR